MSSKNPGMVSKQAVGEFNSSNRRCWESTREEVPRESLQEKVTFKLGFER